MWSSSLACALATTSRIDPEESSWSPLPDRSAKPRPGRAAVRAIQDGVFDHMVTLVRASQEPYVCTTGLAPLDQIANVARPMPPEYVGADGHSITEDSGRYAGPLAGSLPVMPPG